MAFLGFGGKPKQTRTRRTPQERSKLQEVRFLDRLSKQNPAMHERLMLQRLGLDGHADPFEEFEQTVKRLKGLGIIKNPNELGSDSLIKDAIAGIAMFMQMQGQQGQQGQQPGQVIQQPPPQLTPPAAPHYQQPPQIANPAASTPEPADQEPPMTLISQFVIRALENKNPAEAAEWLRTQSYPQAAQLVDAFKITEDDRLPVLLNDLAALGPDFAAVVAWLRKRPEWFVAVVHEIQNQVA